MLSNVGMRLLSFMLHSDGEITKNCYKNKSTEIHQGHGAKATSAVGIDGSWQFIGTASPDMNSSDPLPLVVCSLVSIPLIVVGGHYFLKTTTRIRNPKEAPPVVPVNSSMESSENDCEPMSLQADGPGPIPSMQALDHEAIGERIRQETPSSKPRREEDDLPRGFKTTPTRCSGIIPSPLMKKRFTRTIEDFTCEQCGASVTGNGYTNHCPHCLWSKHVDIFPGDREAECQGLMAPVTLQVKTSSGFDKARILHRCTT